MTGWLLSFTVSRVTKKILVASTLALLAAGVAGFVSWSRRTDRALEESNEISNRVVRELAVKTAALEARERTADETIWQAERLAQDCGRTFEALWDELNAAPVTNRLELLAAWPVTEIALGRWTAPVALPHGIEQRGATGPGPVLAPPAWREFVGTFGRAGWQLDQTEFRHNRFETNAAGQPLRSQFHFAAHLSNPVAPERAQLEGDLVVDWAPGVTNATAARVARIDARRLTLLTRPGEPPFQPLLAEDVTPADPTAYFDPLMLYDLDGDGRSEIILAAKNLVYRRRADGRYEAEPLLQQFPGGLFTAIIADVDGDGRADFLCARSEGLLLFHGSARGTFEEAGRLVWPARPPLKGAMVLTCGDVDQDGDLDVFLGQYKLPTLGQVLQPNFHAANDSYPAALLLNDGHGNFTDATSAAGLAKKRWRRIFSSSLVDLAGEGHLDLLVVSDFAGVDLYRNDGHGHFTDVTRDWIAEPHAFGMGHALADFNADGRLDFLMVGMNSPSVDRLDHLGLVRPGATSDPTMRGRMTYGNRLYLGGGAPGFEQTAFSDSIARSGWSWGCSAFDFDNDGFPDVYIANGEESKQTVREYEPEFWLHSIFVDDAVDDAAATKFFTAQFDRTRGRGWSYGGYEKNRLFLNQRGQSFVELGHLLGVALEADSRNVVTDDLDGDGRVDLLVTTHEVWPQGRQMLRVYRNTLTDGGNWIGFQFREESGAPSPVGARVSVHYDGHTAVRVLATGDSHRSQHANTIHFGLGALARVAAAEIRWPDGRVLTLREPAINRYHPILAPGSRVSPP